MFTDTHCHLFNMYYDNTQEIVENAQKNSIQKMINNGVNHETNQEVLELSKKYNNIYAAIGIHPEAQYEVKETDFDFIEENIEAIVAIGEIGLDYHYEQYDKEKQQEIFERQLILAEKYNKPVIVHSREATEDTINILKKYPSVTGVMHCFSGSIETANIYIKMGYKLGFNGVITFKNAKVKEVIRQIPDSAILLETDSPYLTPEPYRGQTNEPKNIIHIAEFIANLRNISLEQLSKITEDNVKSIFDI